MEEKTKSKGYVLRKLFFACLYLSTFTFGGGYAIIPPMVILSVISVFYDAFCSNYYIAALLKGMTAGVGAVIMSVVYDMGKNVVKSKDWVNVVIMIISFCLSYFLNVNIIYIILLVAVFGMVRTIVKGGREK